MNQNTITATVDHVIHHAVLNAFPSVFTKDDVITLLRHLEINLKEAAKIEEKTNIKFSDKQFDELIEIITNDIAGLGMDMVDDYELSMSYKEVELHTLDLNSGIIEDQVKTSIACWLNSNDDCGC